MAEILVKAIDHTHADPDKDRTGAYKRGMPVCVRPDGHTWGKEEGLPRFVVIKIPGVAVDKVQKYIEQHEQANLIPGMPAVIYRRRRWIIRWADLPVAARNKLATKGELIIKTPAYTGSTYDYTWTQVKAFFRNQETGLDETGALS